MAFAILLFQDIAAIPLIAMVPVLAGAGHAIDTGESINPGLRVLCRIAMVVICER